MVVLTQQESRRLRHDYIGTEHVLLGLIGVEDSIAARALSSLGLDLSEVSSHVVSTVGMGSAQPTGQIPFTPRTKKILELSLREAIGLDHKYIGSEHILLGLMREGEGVAAQVLGELGVELEPLRARIVEMVGRGIQPLSAPTPERPSAITVTRDQRHPDLISVAFVLVALVAVQIEPPAAEIARWGLLSLLAGVLIWAGGSVIGTAADSGPRATNAGRYLRVVGALVLAAAASVFVLGALLG